MLAVAAAGLARRIELSGLGRPRDTEPRLSYLALLGLAVVVPLGVTVATYRWAGITHWLVPVALAVGSLVLCSGWTLGFPIA